MPVWRVPLPPNVRPPFRVFVNGVPQQEGSDYTVREDALEFARELSIDRISKRRWFLGAWGIGTYRKDDSVDVAWEAADGSPRVAHKLPIVAPDGTVLEARPSDRG